MYTNNLTEETKALLRGNQSNPVAAGANQYLQQSATPRLKGLVTMSRPVTYQPLYTQQNNQNSSSVSGGIGDLVNGGMSLMNGLGSLGGSTGEESSDSSDGGLGSDIGSIGGGIMDIYNTLGNSGGSSGGGSGTGALGYIGLANGAMNGVNKFAESGDYKDGVQGMFSIDKDNDSDVMQAIKGTVNGASMGSSFGPWGAAIGGVLGLGSSFIDDI